MKDENPFKEKLYQHTLPVSDELWSRIESQLPADKKRFPFLLFALAVFIVVTAIIVLLSTRDQTREEKINPERTLPTTTTPLSEVNNSTTSNQVDITNTSYDSDHSDKSNGEVKAIVLNDNGNRESKTADSDLNDLPAPKKQLASQKTLTTNNYTVRNDRTSAHSAKSSPAEDISSSSSFIHASRSITSNLSNSDFLPLQSLTFEEINKLSVIDDASILNDLLSLKPDPSCYKFTGEEGNSNLSVDLFVTPGFAPRTFENTGNESVLYAEARKETESSQYAWAAGGRVNLNLNKEFAVRLGVMYEQIGDIFDYTDTLATQRSTRIDSFFSADGTFLYAETNTVLIFGTLIKKIHNRYHHLDIPLLASYELCMGRAVIMLNAGPVINLATSVRGQILNPGFVPQHISASETNRLNAYKSNIGLSFYLGAGALIPFNKYFSGLVEPRFLYRIKPVTNEDYPLKEHRHFAGINLGIRYHFD